MRVAVKVVPRAKSSEIVGWLAGDVLKIRVTAPPADGAANAAVEALLAATLGLKRTQVRIAAGHTASRKVVEIDGVDRAALDAALASRRHAP